MNNNIIGLPLSLALSKLEPNTTYTIKKIDAKDKSLNHTCPLVVNVINTSKNNNTLFVDDFKIDC